MRVVAEDWAELDRAAGAGTARRRLYPNCPHDLFLAVRHPHAVRMLILGVPASSRDNPLLSGGALRSTVGIDLDKVEVSDGHRELQLRLGDSALVEVFNVLISDIAAAVAATAAGAAGALCLVERFQRWVRLLQSLGPDGMSEERRRGLYGELQMLRMLLRAGVDHQVAVASWTGPDEANQDFQLPGLAVEVKTSAARHPRTLAIASERQLDPTGCGCLLLSQLLVDERRGGEGASLNRAVAEIRDLLTCAAPRDRFDELVVRAGYLPHHQHLYDEPRYTVRGQTMWRVEGDFPRITEADLRPGVGSCSYRISTAGMDGHVVTDEDFRRLATGAGRV